jgi:hypothetical protein
MPPLPDEENHASSRLARSRGPPRRRAEARVAYPLATLPSAHVQDVVPKRDLRPSATHFGAREPQQSNGEPAEAPGVLAAMNRRSGAFDLVIGNPPWGGDIAEESYERACEALEFEREPRWDSWELLTALTR